MTDSQPTLTGHDLSSIDWEAAARRMRFLIETNHLTVPDVAHDLGIKQVTLQQILDGESRASEYLIVAAANYFGVSVDFLVSDQSSSKGPTETPRRKSSSSASSRTNSSSGSSLGDLAVRHQALVELLIQNGTITATDYNAAVQKVSERTSKG